MPSSEERRAVRSVYLLVAGALLGAWGVAIRAQDEVPVFHAQTNLVTLHVSITDKNGKLVTDVPRSAFKVYENEVQQQIQSFAREDVPVSMGIIIDSSGSMA